MKPDYIDSLYSEYKVPDFHNVKRLDVLKWLSENPTFPKPICLDYYDQYEKALADMGQCANHQIGEQIFTKFNGNGPVNLIEIVKEFTWQNVTFRAVSIEIPYIRQVLENFGDVNLPRISPNQVVLDIVIDGVSMLEGFISRPVDEYRNASLGLNFLLNSRDVRLLDIFTKPYNGISASRVVEIFQEMCTGRRADEPSSIRSYITRVYNEFAYYTKMEVIAEKFVELKVNKIS
jgi:hypothetical protein